MILTPVREPPVEREVEVERLERLLDLRPPERPVRRQDTRRRALDDVVAVRWTVGIGLAWLALLPLAIAVEPAPADPDAAMPALVHLAVLVFLLGLTMALSGLLASRRWGFLGSLMAAGTLLTVSLSCPVTGHHDLAPWWFVQLGCASALSAASWRGLRRA